MSETKVWEGVKKALKKRRQSKARDIKVKLKKQLKQRKR